MFVKLFEAYSEDRLVQEINEELKGDNYRVVDIKYCMSCYVNSDGNSFTKYSAMIIGSDTK